MSIYEIGILKGKKARYNKLILEVLFSNKPLTLWGIAKEIRKLARSDAKVHKKLDYGRTQIIQSVVSRRLKELTRKTYVKKLKKEWILLLKGIIAVLIFDDKPKQMGQAWYEWIPKFIPKLEQLPSRISYRKVGVRLDVSKKTVQDSYRSTYEFLKKPETYVSLANDARNLIKHGVINLDIISNELLFKLLSHEEGNSFPKGLLNGDPEAALDILRD